MLCLKYFKDEELLEMVRNFMEIYKLDFSEDYMYKVGHILDELENREIEYLRKEHFGK